MPSRDDFDPALYEFAMKAWNDRTSIRNFEDIYGMYAASPIPHERFASQPGQIRTLRSFLRRLLGIDGRVTIELQSSNASFAAVAMNYPGRTPAQPTGAMLWDDFYHCSRPDFDHERIRKRVYMHASSVTNALNVLERLIPRLFLDRELQKIKIAGPGGQDRLDQLVAYCETDASVGRMLTAIGTLDRTWFAAGVPRVVKEVMDGVGIADEPPTVTVLYETPADSFGVFISQLIFLALTEKPVPETEDRYLESLIDTLERAWMNPKEPHLHTRRTSVERWFDALDLASLEMPVRRRNRARV
jgi:hypothetical protein